MTLQKRLERVMKKRGWRVADLARALDQPYTSTREWVLYGRNPGDLSLIEKKIAKLEG